MATHVGQVAALYRYPVKGFTPERLERADLQADAFFPCDRLYAVEDGPSGFDPAAPAFIPKTKFTVLMHLAEVARVRTSYDEAAGVLTAWADGHDPIHASLTEKAGRDAFAAWLADLLGDVVHGPLKVVSGDGHRFTDHPQGYVSIVNLNSVRDLEQRTGWRIDPLRFRANLYVEGWPAWVENEAVGASLRLGKSRASVFKTITRCAAIEVDPATAERDLHIVKALVTHCGNPFCGIYLSVTEAGAVAVGDAATL